jgi:hypothetical protein
LCRSAVSSEKEQERVANPQSFPSLQVEFFTASNLNPKEAQLGGFFSLLSTFFFSLSVFFSFFCLVVFFCWFFFVSSLFFFPSLFRSSFPAMEMAISGADDEGEESPPELIEELVHGEFFWDRSGTSIQDLTSNEGSAKESALFDDFSIPDDPMTALHFTSFLEDKHELLAFPLATDTSPPFSSSPSSSPSFPLSSSPPPSNVKKKPTSPTAVKRFCLIQQPLDKQRKSYKNEKR